MIGDRGRPVRPMTVKDLITHLHTMPQDLPVAYALHSEFTLMSTEDVQVQMLQPHRPDGWVATRWWGTRNEQDALKTVPYVVFPGN